MGIEFIHTATLVHDDLIDKAPTRRGITTIHEALGPDPAVIIGDYYFAKGAYLLAEIGDPAIDSAISKRRHDHLHGRAAADDQPQRV